MSRRFLTRIGGDTILGSRKEAIAAGHTKYIGKPCAFGHSGARYASDSNCVSCSKQRSRNNLYKLKTDFSAYDDIQETKRLDCELKEVWDD